MSLLNVLAAANSSHVMGGGQSGIMLADACTLACNHK